MSKRKVLTGLFISCSIFIVAGCDNVSASDNQEIIKSQVLSNIDSTRTLGTALEHRQRCESFQWEDGSDTQGRKIVTYTCTMSPDSSMQIWKTKLDKIIDDTSGVVKNIQDGIERSVEFCKRNNYESYDCKRPDRYDSAKKTMSEHKIKLDSLNRFKNIKVTDVKQVITWSVIPGYEQPIQMISATYNYKFNDGNEYNANQTYAILIDIYRDTDYGNPVESILSKYISNAK